MFQDPLTSVFEEDFLKLFSIYGHGGHLDDGTWTIYILLSSGFSRRLHMKFGFKWTSGFGDDLK